MRVTLATDWCIRSLDCIYVEVGYVEESELRWEWDMREFAVTLLHMRTLEFTAFSPPESVREVS